MYCFLSSQITSVTVAREHKPLSSPLGGTLIAVGVARGSPRSLPQCAGALVHILQSLPCALWCASENHLRAQGDNCLDARDNKCSQFCLDPLLTSTPVLVLVFIILHGLRLCLLFLQAAGNSPYPLPSIPETFNNKTTAMMMTMTVLLSGLFQRTVFRLQYILWSISYRL